MADNKINNEEEKISGKDAAVELFKLGSPFLLMILIYFIFFS